MKKFWIVSLGYDGGPDFSTLSEARAALAEMVGDSLAKCRAHFGAACKMKLGTDSYAVKIGNAQSISIYSTFTIIPA